MAEEALTFFREMGRKRWAGKSAEKRSAHARMMAEARRKKRLPA